MEQSFSFLRGWFTNSFDFFQLFYNSLFFSLFCFFIIISDYTKIFFWLITKSTFSFIAFTYFSLVLNFPKSLQAWTMYSSKFVSGSWFNISISLFFDCKRHCIGKSEDYMISFIIFNWFIEEFLSPCRCIDNLLQSRFS